MNHALPMYRFLAEFASIPYKVIPCNKFEPYCSTMSQSQKTASTFGAPRAFAISAAQRILFSALPWTKLPTDASCIRLHAAGFSYIHHSDMTLAAQDLCVKIDAPQHNGLWQSHNSSYFPGQNPVELPKRPRRNQRASFPTIVLNPW